MNIPEPHFEFIEGTIRARLIDDWVLWCRYLFPKGFETDFASVPRFLWPVAAPMGILRYGSIPHDFGYQHRFLLTVHGQRVCEGESRKFFDRLMLDITIAKTGAKKRAWVAYVLVRAFGWIAWNKYRKEGPVAYNENSLHLKGA